MTTRTTKTVVHFSSAFTLPGSDEPQPAGDYRVDHEEELIEGLSRIAWRRVTAFVFLPALGHGSPVQQMMPVNPAAFDALLEKDHNPT